MYLLAPSILYTVQTDFIQLCFTIFITCLFLGESNQVFIKKNHMSSVESYFLFARIPHYAAHNKIFIEN